MAYWTRTLKMVDREQHGVWARREKEITTWETQRTSFCNDTPSLWSFFCPDQKSYAMTCPTWHRIFMILNVSSPLPNFNHQTLSGRQFEMKTNPLKYSPKMWWNYSLSMLKSPWANADYASSVLANECAQKIGTIGWGWAETYIWRQEISKKSTSKRKYCEKKH